MKFDWDEGNINHILYDNPERNNTIDEVEIIFFDLYFFAEESRLESNGEQRYRGIGIGKDGIEKFVVFVIRFGKIRPISFRRANFKEKQKYYYEIRQKEINN